VASLASILYETLVPTSIGYADERVVNTKARVNRTLQDHLVDERRVAGITTAAANRRQPLRPGALTSHHYDISPRPPPSTSDTPSPSVLPPHT
jgi:hypothetical protein